MTLPGCPVAGLTVWCPSCDRWVPGSAYLATVFPPEAEWRRYFLACYTTHARHSHVSYYNRWVGWQSFHRSYEAFKHEVNERAKRQLIRKSGAALRLWKITAEDFAALQGTTEETLVLATRELGPGPTVTGKGQASVEAFG